MRWRIAISWRGAGDIHEDREEVITDLAGVGQLVAEGPDGWLTSYLCVTVLEEREAVTAPEQPVIEIPQLQEAAA